MIERILRQKIEGMIGSEKAVIIMGPRQVGKSTLLHEMFGASQDVLWLNGDEPDVVCQCYFYSFKGNHW